MLYLALLRNHWRSFGRSHQEKRVWIMVLGMLPVVIYFVMALVGFGLYFGRLFHVAAATPFQTLNAHLLSVFSGLLALRFFFQRAPRMEATPYLHLPIPRRRLVRYYQVASLASVHNLYPLLFFVPFWLQHAPDVLPPVSALTWPTGILLCLLLSHHLNTLLRGAVDQHARLLVAAVLILSGLYLADQAVGADLLSRLSSYLFDALAAGHAPTLLLLAGLTGLAQLAARRTLMASLTVTRSETKRRLQVLGGRLRFGRSPIVNLVVMELLMMWRNKRSRQYVLISVGVSTLYTALLLSDFNRIFGSLMAAAIGLFASGVFSLNYGQLMFAWESRYFDGLMARAVQLEHIVLAKFMVLMGSCLSLFMISLPLFFWLAPELLQLHVAFLFYNAGVTSILMLTLAVFNRRRVNAGEGSFFNYQGFSILHWLWIIPTIIPPAFLLFVFEATPETALALIAMLGLGSMLLAWPSSKLLAHILAHRKYVMAAGFRSYDR